MPDALEDRIRACTKCAELVAGRNQVVVGDTPPGARVLLLGEGPGAQEDAAGRPFVGRSGQLLDTLLGEAGLARAEVAVLNVVKCRPPGNRVPTRAEAANCRPWLDAQLAELAPEVVVTLGTTATAALLGRQKSLGAAREASPHAFPLPRVVEGAGGAGEGAGGEGSRGAGAGAGGAAATQVVATYHPSAALRWGPNGEPRRLLVEDLVRARELAGG